MTLWKCHGGLPCDQLRTSDEVNWRQKWTSKKLVPSCECGAEELVIHEPLVKVVQTTCPKSAENFSKWIHFRRKRTVKRDERVWVFPDGSSTGSYAAVVVHKKHSGAHVRHAKQAPSRNVAAEVMGVALGLRHSPKGSRVVVVSDYVGTGAWLAGHWKVRNRDCLLRLGAISEILFRRNLKIGVFVHHRGHQKDRTDFTRYNNEADRLCSTRDR